MATWDNDAMDELARGAGIARDVQNAADEIAQIVRNDAPVDSGDFKGGIRTRLKYQRRAVAVVEATDEKSLIVESRTGVMARAVKKAARQR